MDFSPSLFYLPSASPFTLSGAGRAYEITAAIEWLV